MTRIANLFENAAMMFGRDQFDYSRLVEDTVAKNISEGYGFVRFYSGSSRPEWCQTELPLCVRADDPEVKPKLIDYYKGMKFGNQLEAPEYDQYRKKK